jgi:hypothetical protein
MCTDFVNHLYAQQRKQPCGVITFTRMKMAQYLSGSAVTPLMRFDALAPQLFFHLLHEHASSLTLVGTADTGSAALPTLL